MTALWQDQLPDPVLHQVASHRLGGGATNMKATLALADAIYHTVEGAGNPTIAAVSPASAAQKPAPAGATPATNFPDIDSLAAHLTAEIAAFRGTNNRGAYTRGQSNQRYPRGNPQSQTRRPPPVRKPLPHSNGPPPNACVNHWNHGRNTYSCAAKETCPWKDILTTRPRRQ